MSIPVQDIMGQMFWTGLATGVTCYCLCSILMSFVDKALMRTKFFKKRYDTEERAAARTEANMWKVRFAEKVTLCAEQEKTISELKRTLEMQRSLNRNANAEIAQVLTQGATQ